MARLESTSSGGYFKTPTHLIPLLASMIEVVGQEVDVDDEMHKSYGYAPPVLSAHSLLDPCAGDGEALYLLRDALFTDKMRKPELRTVEMEKTRFAALLKRVGEDSGIYTANQYCLHGDAFCVRFERGHNKKGCNLLYLNPPYDADKECARLEERFLSRYVETLCVRGVLVFVVPYYALKASAATIAKHFRHLACVRFPSEDFASYKQVFLLGEKHAGHEAPDPEVLAQVLAWASDPESIPTLGEDTGCVARLSPMSTNDAGFSSWRVESLDVSRFVAAYQPWKVSDRGGKLSQIKGIVPEGSVESMLDRKYPLAMPPKPAHIATGVAAGIFNGSVIYPDDTSAKMPPLLVKGCFDKEWLKESDKKNADGDVVGQVEVQQPKLVVTAFDLVSKSYHTLTASAAITDAASVGELTTADLLDQYGMSLMGVMLKQCPVLHDPSREADYFELPPLPRKLFKAQAEVVRASVKLLGGPGRKHLQKRQGQSAWVLGEVGSGKSTVALATADCIQARKVLIMCPPHLLAGWTEQIQAVTPWARVAVLADVEDARAFCEAPHVGPWGGMQVAILSREAAKLGTAMEGISTPACPRCGAETPEPPEMLAKKRMRCEGVTRRPGSQYTRLAYDLALAVYAAVPDNHAVRQI